MSEQENSAYEISKSYITGVNAGFNWYAGEKFMSPLGSGPLRYINGVKGKGSI